MILVSVTTLHFQNICVDVNFINILCLVCRTMQAFHALCGCAARLGTEPTVLITYVLNTRPWRTSTREQMNEL